MTNKIKTPPYEVGALCHECLLGPQIRENHVPCETSSRAEFAVVGNYPSQDAVKERRPFMGKSGNCIGQVLVEVRYIGQMLSLVGLLMDEWMRC